MGNTSTHKLENSRETFYEHLKKRDFSSVGNALNWINNYNPNHFTLSEVIFYARFFLAEDTTPAESQFFSVPSQASDSYDYFSDMLQFFLESGSDRKKAFKQAWESTMQNKLYNITACGHLSDVLFWSIFFDSRQEAKRAITSAHEAYFKSPTPSMEQFCKVLRENPDKSFVARFETDVHVFSLEFPKINKSSHSLEERECYLIESVLNICDSRVRQLTIKRWLKLVSQSQVIAVAEYDIDQAVSRVKNTVRNCYNVSQLHSNLPYFTSTKSWNEILNSLHHLNLILQSIDESEERRSIYSNLLTHMN